MVLVLAAISTVILVAEFVIVDMSQVASAVLTVFVTIAVLYGAAHLIQKGRGRKSE